MKSEKLFIYADGGSRGNPGPSGIGFIILDDKKKKVKEVFRYIGETTNNIAEYTALIAALEEAARFAAGNAVVVHLDSELVEKQLSGEYRVKDARIKPLFEKALGIIKTFKEFEIKHIDREKNRDADKLVNKAINLAGLF